MRQLVYFLLLVPAWCAARQGTATADTARASYLAALKTAGKAFTADFRPNYVRYHRLGEREFVREIDGVRQHFRDILAAYKSSLHPAYAAGQELEIRYYFDRLLAEYPLNHEVQTGESAASLRRIPQRLRNNLPAFNDRSLLANQDFNDFVKAYMDLLVSEEWEKKTYRSRDNRWLSAEWTLLNRYVTDPVCRDFREFNALYDHIDNNGIAGIEPLYRRFVAECRDTGYVRKLTALYREDSVGRTGHVVKTYKTVNGALLNLHLFMPAGGVSNKRPVMVMFHGGSWTEGKPDWFFPSCRSYADNGWVACAVEYRTYGKNHTLPFDAVKDARSAIRWLRAHADELGIDTGRVVAAGNSAGGHLVLACALADKWNERSDDMRISPIPNLLLVNSGVYDLSDEPTAWIRRKLGKKSAVVKEIAPLDLVRNGAPPMLLIHGTEDHNVPFAGAQRFAAMKSAGNTLEFLPLTGATHFIWYDEKFAPQVSKARQAFLAKFGY